MKKIMIRVLSLCIISSICLSSVNTISIAIYNEEKSPEIIIGQYHNDVRELMLEDGLSESALDVEISNLKNERDMALNDVGYDIYYVENNNIAQIEEALDTDLSEIGLDDGGSYMIAVGGNINTTTRGSAGKEFTYTYNGITYTMRNFVVTSNDPEASSGYAQSSTVNVLNSSTQSVIENALNTAISAYVSSINNALGTVASICGLSISNFGTIRYNNFRKLKSR